MNKEKEIEGMAKVIVKFKEKHDIPLGVGFHSVDLSKHIIEAGYRKADEVRKETAKEILREIFRRLDNEIYEELGDRGDDVNYYTIDVREWICFIVDELGRKYALKNSEIV